ncbi:MAG: hypothetical protein CNLJKLNK_00526 [Holosporales bacterium]
MRSILQAAFCCVLSCVVPQKTYASLAIDYGVIQQSPLLRIEQGLQNGQITPVADFEKGIVLLLNSKGEEQDSVTLTKIKDTEIVNGDTVRVVSLYQYQIGDRFFDLSSENEYPILKKIQSHKNKKALKETVGTLTYYETGKEKKQLSLTVDTVSPKFLKLNPTFEMLFSVAKAPSTVMLNGHFIFSDGETFEGITPELPILYKTCSWKRIKSTTIFQERLGGYVLWNGQQEIDLSRYYEKNGKRQKATVLKEEHLIEEKNGRKKFGTQFNSPENEPFWVYRFDDVSSIKNHQKNIQKKPLSTHRREESPNRLANIVIGGVIGGPVGAVVGAFCSIM